MGTITLNGGSILFVGKYIYLGQMITFDHKIDDEIRRRRSAAWLSFKNIDDMLKKTKDVKLRAYLFNYGCEVWIMREIEK